MGDFGERLKRLRKSMDITQGQLAEVIGVVPSAVGKYERLEQSYQIGRASCRERV